MIWWIYLLFLPSVNGLVHVFEFVINARTTRVFYDEDQLDANTAFVSTATVDDITYVTQTQGTVNFSYSEVACTQVIVNTIPTGPAAWLEDGVVSNRNTNSFEDAVVLKDLLERYFSVRPDSDECIRNGGTVKTCLGPLYLFQQGVSRPVPVTNETLLRAWGIASVSGQGYGAGAPSITYLDVRRPTLQVETDCVDGQGSPFTGSYAPIDTDPFLLLNVTEAYARQDNLITQRLVIRRIGYQFYAQLGDSTPIAGVFDYEVFHTSSEPVEADFEYYLPVTLTSNDSSCTFTISMNPVPLPLELLVQEPLTGINYYQNRLPTHYERTLVCGFEICRLDINNNYFTPNCPEGEFRGGSDSGKILQDFIEIPIEIPADLAYQHYYEECESFYPWAVEFNVFDGFALTGGLQARQVTVTCRGPPYNPSAIVQAIVPSDEMYLQCTKLGGWVFGASRTHCARQTDVRKCHKDWYYFDGYCYYKFQYATEADFYVPQEFAEEQCARLGSDVEVFSTPTTDQTEWLRNVYVGIQRQDPTRQYRARIEGDRCFCFSYDDTVQPNVGTIVACNCQDRHFPICRYKKESRIIPYEEIGMSPITHRLYRDGQRGIPWLGRPRTCECGIGSSGPWCNSGTCPTFIDIETNPDSTLSQFFGRCYFQNRGGCQDQNPSSCICFENFGPPASLNPNSPVNKFQDFPCACPTAGDPALGEFGFQINSQRFLENYAVCGGVTHGICLLDNSTTLARCVSVNRVDLSEGLLRRIEPAYNGKAMECRVATKPANNFFINTLTTEGFCNGRGSCCSSGEVDRNQLVTDQDVSFYWRTTCLDPVDGTARSGCVCDKTSEDKPYGWTGDSCTCPFPGDLASDLVTQIELQTSYVSFRFETVVARVRTAPVRYDSTTTATGCTPLGVFVADTITSTRSDCVFREGNGWNTEDYWDCFFNRGLVVGVTTVEQTPECEITVNSQVFNPCGNNTNPYAGRYSANEFYRGPDLSLEEQPIQFAPFGCTTTECMCDQDHSGELCAFGISSKRRDEDNEFSSRVCGEDTQPARGRLGDLECECFKTPDFGMVGDACECANTFVPQLGRSELCYAHGTCIAPSFTYGRCQFDIDDLETDPLVQPFSQQTVLNRSVEYTIDLRNSSLWDNGEGDLRSVFTIDGYSWLIDSGDTFVFSSVQGNVSMCAPRVRFPLNMTYTCTEFTSQRAISNTTIWAIDVSETFQETYEQCDPSVFDESDPLKCSTVQFCKEEWVEAGTVTLVDFDNTPNLDLRKCISRMVWRPLEGEDEVLQTGFYQNVSVICADAFVAQANATAVADFVLGIVFDCSDPVDRLLDDAVDLILGDRQCDFSITPYSNVLGEAYGLFFNELPGLSFVNESSWTDEHYWFIASFTNYTFCTEDFYTRPVFDRIITSWVEEFLPPPTDLTSNSTDELLNLFRNDDLDNRPDQWWGRYLYGSRVLNSLDTYPTLIPTTNFTWNRNAGNFAFLPRFQLNTSITQLIVEAHVPIPGMQVITESGQVCGTYLKTLEVGEKVTFDCFEAFQNSEANAMIEIFNESPPATDLDAVAADWAAEDPSTNYIWWYARNQFNLQEGVDFLNASIAGFQRFQIDGSARDDSARALFDAYRTLILTDKRLPPSNVYPTECAAKGFEALPITELNDTMRLYLRDFYMTHLGPRRCTSDWQCRTYARSEASTCVPDSSLWIGWRQGDPTKFPFEGNGDEGGCECDASWRKGFFELQQFCGRCVFNAGPFDDADWLRVIQFQEGLLEQFPSITPPLYTNTSWTTVNFEEMKDSVTCRLPWSDSSPRVGLCGGYGRVSDWTIETERFETLVFKNNLEINEARRCTGLVVPGDYFYTLQNETQALDFFSYSNGSSTITVIEDSLYLNNGLLQINPAGVDCLSGGDECTFQDADGEEYLVRCTYSPREKDGFRIEGSLEKRFKSFLYEICIPLKQSKSLCCVWILFFVISTCLCYSRQFLQTRLPLGSHAIHICVVFHVAIVSLE